MVGVGIQDTRGLITGEVGLYKIPGVSLPGRWGYTRYQGSHHWGGGAIQDTRGSHYLGGGAIQDTRGLITGEGEYMKVPSPQHARVGP